MEGEPWPLGGMRWLSTVNTCWTEEAELCLLRPPLPNMPGGAAGLCCCCRVEANGVGVLLLGRTGGGFLGGRPLLLGGTAAFGTFMVDGREGTPAIGELLVSSLGAGEGRPGFTLVATLLLRSIDFRPFVVGAANEG